MDEQHKPSKMCSHIYDAFGNIFGKSVGKVMEKTLKLSPLELVLTPSLALNLCGQSETDVALLGPSELDSGGLF